MYYNKQPRYSSVQNNSDIDSLKTRYAVNFEKLSLILVYLPGSPSLLGRWGHVSYTQKLGDHGFPAVP